MNSYSIKNAIREELSQQVRSAIHDAIDNMDLDDMIQECIDDVVEDEICNIFENL